VATKAIGGYNGKVLVSSDGGTTYEPVAEVKEHTITINAEELDATNYDSQGWSENVPGFSSWEVSLTANYIGDDSGQEALRDAVINHTRVMVQLAANYDNGEVAFEGLATITSFEVSSAVDSVVELSLELMGSGPLTTTTLSTSS